MNKIDLSKLVIIAEADVPERGNPYYDMLFEKIPSGKAVQIEPSQNVRNALLNRQKKGRLINYQITQIKGKMWIIHKSGES